MSRLLRQVRVILAAGLLGPALLLAQVLLAQDWQSADSLPGVDLANLSAAQKATVLKILREESCSCGCNMKLAECRMEDPSCSYSTGLALAVVDAIRQGKTEAQAIAAVHASKWAHVQAPKLLDDPISIPVAGAPVRGPGNAPVTIVEFSDFQCPYCAAAAPQINALLKAYPTQVKLIYKEYPLDIHSQANLAADAAVAAQKQGKFWPMYDSLFQIHDELSRANILNAAKANGLDMNRFQADIDSTIVRETVIRDIQDGDRAGVEGTPTIFIDGQRYNGPIDLNSLKPILDAELKHPAHVASPQP